MDGLLFAEFPRPVVFVLLAVVALAWATPALITAAARTWARITDRINRRGARRALAGRDDAPAPVPATSSTAPRD